MICRDIFAVKNGNCYEYMTFNRRLAENRASTEQHHNERLGLTALVKLVHPSEYSVRVYTAANGKLDK